MLRYLGGHSGPQQLAELGQRWRNMVENVGMKTVVNTLAAQLGASWYS